jgi:hypothetical protein
MRLARLLIVTAAALASMPAHAQSADDDLRIFAVSVINVAPFRMPFSGYGIYLGESAIITPAHVVGHWSLFSNPRVIIAGQEISAKVIKKGSFPQLDLAQLSIEQASLPDSLRLRRNPLCQESPRVGTNVVVVYPERTARYRIISALAIAPQYRNQFGSLISEPQGSGSGVYNADKRCLLGIMSASVARYDSLSVVGLYDFMGDAVVRLDFQRQEGRVGYFVPAAAIAEFIPAHYRF